MKAIISILTVLFLSAFSIAPDQVRMISGSVSDEAGIPMAGVTVVVKGTSNGTLTDLNGAYQLQVNPEAKYLVFSYIGYETEEVKIPRSNRINVTRLLLWLLKRSYLMNMIWHHPHREEFQVFQSANPQNLTTRGHITRLMLLLLMHRSQAISLTIPKDIQPLMKTDSRMYCTIPSPLSVSMWTEHLTQTFVVFLIWDNFPQWMQ